MNYPQILLMCQIKLNLKIGNIVKFFKNPAKPQYFSKKISKISINMMLEDSLFRERKSSFFKTIL